MTQTIAENAQNATHTATAAAHNGERARTGGEVVGQTIDTIQHIADVVASSADKVERLGTSSREIGAILQVINDIADQTNLLALNAAIEAARAGEEGRGFAVVADEVRKLAERTTGATKQISDMIGTIRGDVEATIQAIHSGRDEIAGGLGLADQAGHALSEIVEHADGVVTFVDQIAAATEEQSATSEQIARSIEAIRVASSGAAEGIDQIAQTADSLAAMTDTLRALVGQFQVATEPGAEHVRA
jgi:methyl-accepting chemotaxis protein